MNEKSPNSCISKKKLKDACTTTDFLESSANDGQASTRSTYFHPVTLPHHITELLRLQREIQNERESTYHRYYNTLQGPAQITTRSRMIKLSESSLDVYIPSYPGSPRSLNLQGSNISILSDEDNEDWKRAIEFIHRDHELLVAAENGNDVLIEAFIRKGINIQQRDHLGRNALHLAVCAENVRAIVLLLKAGIIPTVKDNLGMTPLSLCLMRRPSIAVANLLFAYGAVILPRATPNDTGLFLQFIMMCEPTTEERKIIRLLVEKGAKVNDPEAPGGRQALHFAAMSNNCDLIRILVDLGADHTMTNHRNETPKEVARTFLCKDAFKLLSIIETMLGGISTLSRLAESTDTEITTIDTDVGSLFDREQDP